MIGNWTSTERHLHNAIHDIEAFFWVLTYLCLTRQGPGGRCRDELMLGRPHDSVSGPIINTYWCLLGNEDIQSMAKNKSRIFIKDHYKKHVLQYIHPYFSPLKGLLLKWWKILRLAYQYPCFEAVHDAFLNALQDTILELKRQTPTSDEGPQAEEAASAVDKFCKIDLASLQSFPRVMKDYDNEATFWPHGLELSPSRDIKK